VKTLLLDQTAWDLVLDASGNIALADHPYAIAQDVASAIRTFLGEAWYDTTLGLPYFDKILGKLPPLSLIQTLVLQAALKVPEVAQAKVVGLNLKNRAVTGTVEIIDTKGQLNNVHF
jgi:hypothetical protein